jgi:hypothetical protein
VAANAQHQPTPAPTLTSTDTIARNKKNAKVYYAIKHDSKLGVAGCCVRRVYNARLFVATNRNFRFVGSERQRDGAVHQSLLIAP